VDAAEFYWGWLNGLVRRVAIGVLFYLLFAVICALLVLSTLERDHALENLDSYSREHNKLTGTFLEVAAAATELAGAKRRAGAMSAVQPLRESLAAVRDAKLASVPCADSWLEGLRNLQAIPSRIAASCRWSDATCEVPHDKLVLDDLVAFEKGIASAQDMLGKFDILCFSDEARPAFCRYYLEHRDKEVAELGGMIFAYYREKVPPQPGVKRLLNKSRSCESDVTYLTSARALEAEIDPTARPRTLSDFESLGATIATTRVAMQSEDTRLSSAPAGGFFTVLIPKDVSFPVLNFLGLTAILYAFLQLRRLRILGASHTLEAHRVLYRLYPNASHVFTAPVFGVGAKVPTGNWARGGSVWLASIMFDKIPFVARWISALAVVGAIVLLASDTNELSILGVGISAMLFVLQAIATRAYRLEQAALQQQFTEWVEDHPEEDVDPDPKGVEPA
jgi:hypothetical protein